jgi:hypothetical protein
MVASVEIHSLISDAECEDGTDDFFSEESRSDLLCYRAGGRSALLDLRARQHIIGLDTETVNVWYEHAHKNKKKGMVCRQRTQLYSFAVNDELGSFCSTDFRDLLEYLEQKDKKNALIFCHNLEFDLNALEDLLFVNNIIVERSYAKTRIIGADVTSPNGIKVKMRDSFNFYPMALEKVGRAIGMKKGTQPDWIGERIPAPDEVKEFLDYNIKDAEVTRRAVIRLHQLLDFNEVPCATLSSLAFRMLTASCPWLPGTKQDIAMENKARNSYYGGMVTSFVRGKVEGTKDMPIRLIDANGLYATVMQQGTNFPDIREEAHKVSEPDLHSMQGFAHCLVYVPDELNVPPLPVRRKFNKKGEVDKKKGDLKLVFPVGTFDGWWTYAKLRKLKELGGEIIECHDAYEWCNWPHRESPFKSFIDRLSEKRYAAILAENPEDIVFKLAMNSSYGKLGEAGERVMLKRYSQIKKLDGWTHLNKYYCMKVVKGKLPKHTRFILAATITSDGQDALQDMMRLLEDNDSQIIYGDTDSVAYLGDRLADKHMHDYKLGYWKEEGHYDWFLPIRSKVYYTPSRIKIKGFKMPKRKKFKDDEGIWHIEPDDEYYYRQTRWLDGELSRTHKKEETAIEGDYWTFSKMRGSAMRNMSPNTFIKTIKEINGESDGKRAYDVKLTTKQLLTQFTSSKPLKIVETKK